MATAARNRGMFAGEREFRLGIVVELGASPVRRRVALRAVGWKSCRNVIGIVGGLHVP